MITVKSPGKVEAALKEIVAKMTNASTVRVGFPADATYPDGTSLPLVAAIQEYGAPSRGIPPRPFMRNTVAEHGSEWPDAAASLLVASGYDAAKTLGLVGEGIKGQLEQSIVGFASPPNAPSTIAKKGFDAPLRDTGHMLNSITVEVE